jgi:hypothetical protein
VFGLAHATWRPTVVITFAVATIASLVVQWPTMANAQSGPNRVILADFNGSFPVGTLDSAEPSGYSPPSTTALAGYKLNYVGDFTGSAIPRGWDVFNGVPGGDPGGFFGASHVVVANGLLQLNTFRNPAAGNRWVTGGLCQCGVSRKYGAYFVRSRLTSAGPNEVELLWPATNKWPPEIDFNETGGSATSTSTSVHYGVTNHIVKSLLRINMTLWHTWGVIWTPKFIVYTVDGRIWGSLNVASEIPRVRMTLDLEQIQQCQEVRQCPTAPTSMQVNWVAEYVTSSTPG